MANKTEAFIKEEEACDIFRSIINGVSYCHKKKIVHRDLKLENILLTVPTTATTSNTTCTATSTTITQPTSQQIANGIKIADFGLSAIYSPGNTSKSKVGSLAYMPPEVTFPPSNSISFFTFFYSFLII
jgi:serine/threonine protein kinase